MRRYGSPDESSPYIELDPPPEPSNPILLDDAANPSLTSQINSYIDYSPQKKQKTNFRTGGIHSRKRAKLQRTTLTTEAIDAFPSFSISDHDENFEDLGLPFTSEPVSRSDNLGLAAHNDSYSIFSEGVLVGATPFYRLTSNIFVVQGWDTRLDCSSGKWHHLQLDYSLNPIKPVCYCTAGQVTGDCVHQRFLSEYELDIFEPSSETGSPIILFFREEAESGFQNLFSVPSRNDPHAAKNRTITMYTGMDSGEGDWRCMRDGSSNSCSHIHQSKEYFAKLFPIFIPGGSESEYSATVLNVNLPGIKIARPISHLPIAPPKWSRIPSDPILYPDIPAVDKAPDIIQLGSSSKCHCGQKFDSHQPIMVQSCFMYTLTQRLEAKIQVQICPTCSKKSQAIGPDCRELGIFNLNNHSLFSHDLLDEYTLSYTTSETPFNAWIKVVSARYKRYQNDSNFADEKLFRTAWFGYAALLALDGDMQCPKCGVTPDAVIWDGVTVSFNKKHLQQSLYPPTTIHSDSVIQQSSYPRHQSFIQNPECRKHLSYFFSGPFYTGDPKFISQQQRENDDDETSSDDDHQTMIKQFQSTLARIKSIPEIEKLLDGEDIRLRIFFQKYCSASQLLSNQGCPKEVASFFKQLSSSDSLLQVINRSALIVLENFVENPSELHLNYLACIPSLYWVLKQEKSPLDNITLGICQWVIERVKKTLLDTIKSDPPPIDSGAKDADGGWKMSGCKYSMPQIRHRPQYPNLRYDGRMEPKGRGGKCNKYYSEYGEQGLTGGIMCAWCTHSICYGYHCIPSNEGRNDVFSAMITRWPSAPKYVIYDFSCQLGPYCRAREPEFFADTLFLIDNFHSSGHNKCSEAFFLKTYSQGQPFLGRINSSAAECGNGGLTRIRKSVRYMGQERAIIYTAVFLSCWNRARIRYILGVK